jgi:hypothetical protein
MLEIACPGIFRFRMTIIEVFLRGEGTDLAEKKT